MQRVLCETTAPTGIDVRGVAGYRRFLDHELVRTFDGTTYTFGSAWDLSVSDLLGLLHALHHAVREGGENGFDALAPEIPELAYRYIPHSVSMLGIHDPSNEMIARAVAKVTGIQVSTFGEEISVTCDPDFAGAFCYAVERYREAQKRVFRTVITVGAMLVNLPLKLLLLLLVIGLELEVDSWTQSNLTPVATTWALTLWAPITCLARRLFGSPIVRTGQGA